jgi:hypothetical protein
LEYGATGWQIVFAEITKIASQNNRKIYNTPTGFGTLAAELSLAACDVSGIRRSAIKLAA